MPTALEVKAAVRARDGFRCVECGMSRIEHFAKYGRDLDVHRVVPGSAYSLEGCVTVCRLCHGPLPKGEANPDGRAGHLLPARVSEPLWELLQDVALRERRSVSQAVIILLEEALTLRGVNVS